MAPQVLTLPKWVLVLRGLQILFAVIILGFSAYGVYWIAFNVSRYSIQSYFDSFNLTNNVSVLGIRHLHQPCNRHNRALRFAHFSHFCPPCSLQLLGHPRSRCRRRDILAFIHGSPGSDSSDFYSTHHDRWVCP